MTFQSKIRDNGENGNIALVIMLIVLASAIIGSVMRSSNIIQKIQTNSKNSNLLGNMEYQIISGMDCMESAIVCNSRIPDSTAPKSLSTPIYTFIKNQKMDKFGSYNQMLIDKDGYQGGYPYNGFRIEPICSKSLQQDLYGQTEKVIEFSFNLYPQSKGKKSSGDMVKGFVFRLHGCERVALQ